MVDSEPEHAISRAYHESLLSGEESIDQLREACSSLPEDLERRARLLGALMSLRVLEPSSEAIEEVVWWIRHHVREIRHVEPALSTLSDAPCWAYQRVREAFESVLAEHGDDPEITLAAAEFFQDHESDRSLALLERAHSASDSDPRPARKAGGIWWLRSLRFSRKGAPERDPLAAAEALRWFERALDRESGASQRCVTLPDACEAALAAGQPQRAGVLAQELLSLAASVPVGWNTGNAIYTAHSVLGEIALGEGAIDRAKEQLKLAGQTPGSPQLDSFGPELGLADALLKHGERDAVMAFLREIGRFWRGGRGWIELWCQEIERGGTPELSSFQD